MKLKNTIFAAGLALSLLCGLTACGDSGQSSGTDISDSSGGSGGSETTSATQETAGTSAQETDDTLTSENDEMLLNEIHLSMPEEYEIQYEVTETAGLSRTYVQSMIKTSEGCYLHFEDTGEQYIFLLRDDGSYTQYIYDVLRDKFIMSEIPVDKNTVDGYAVRISGYFDFYEAYRGNMTYQGVENINGWDCRKYTSEAASLTRSQTAELWIEPEMGLCVQAAYQYDVTDFEVGTKNVKCVKLSTENVTLPAYE